MNHHAFRTKSNTACVVIILLLAKNLTLGNPIFIPPNPEWSVTLVDELEILEDESKSIDINQLLKYPLRYTFQKNNLKTQDLKYRYWARCSIVLKANDPDWLDFSSNFWRYVQVYITDTSGLCRALKFGLFENHAESSYLFLPNHPYTLYIAYNSEKYFRREINVNLVIRKTNYAFEQRAVTNYLDGIVLGIMFGLALYNLFLFFSVRERNYFWYSAYTLSIVVMFITWHKDTPSHLQQIFIKSHAADIFYLRKIIENLTWVLYGMFARAFLNTRQTTPRLDKVIIISIIVTGMAIFQSVYFTGSINIYFHFLIALVCIIAGTIRYINGYKIARFFLVAQVFVLLGLLIVSGQYLGFDFLFFLPKNELSNYLRTPSTLYVCGAIESILFSFALGGKYNALQQDIARVKLEKEQEKQALLKAQNETLEQQVNQRTLELTQSLESLKLTQAQLIQSEKMASLGELTAGIAHEIQNPLNFINNFSALNVDLLSETNDQTSGSSRFESREQLNEIIRKNSEKINYHGHRIDSIVKSMLEHSRSGQGKVEEVNINTLVEEALKLAFHGYKAKEKTFNASYETVLEADLPMVRLVKQDINRVLLNIINNAFYTLHHKNKSIIEKLDINFNNTINTSDYKPKLRVSTRSVAKSIEISILDNGTGIPSAIKEKIFQPFFTTKPTGEGTGLGLSLAYDIITKSMHGKIEVFSEPGEYTEFKISIPIN